MDLLGYILLISLKFLNSKVRMFPAICISRNVIVVVIRNFQIMDMNVFPAKLDPNLLQKLLLNIFKFRCQRHFTASPFSMASQSMLFAFRRFDPTRTHGPMFCKRIQASTVGLWSNFWGFLIQRVCHCLSCPCTSCRAFSIMTPYLSHCCWVTSGWVEGDWAEKCRALITISPSAFAASTVLKSCRCSSRPSRFSRCCAYFLQYFCMPRKVFFSEVYLFIYFMIESCNLLLWVLGSSSKQFLPMQVAYNSLFLQIGRHRQHSKHFCSSTLCLSSKPIPRERQLNWRGRIQKAWALGYAYNWKLKRQDCSLSRLEM